MGVCNRCKGKGHYAQFCPKGRVYLHEFFDAQGFRDARRDLAALEPTNEKEQARKQWVSSFLDKIDKAYDVPDANGLRWLRVLVFVLSLQ